MAGVKITGEVIVSGEVAIRRFNEPPIWSTIEGSLGNIKETETKAFNPGAVDPDSFPNLGDLTYTLDSGTLPSGLSLNAATGQISGTAGVVGSDTVHNFTLRASDESTPTSNQGKSETRNFAITQVNNIAPAWTTPAGSIGTVHEGASDSFAVVATDPNDAETYIFMAWAETPFKTATAR